MRTETRFKLLIIASTMLLGFVSMGAAAQSAIDHKNKPNLRITGVTWQNVRCGPHPTVKLRTVALSATARVNISNYSKGLLSKMTFKTKAISFTNPEAGAQEYGKVATNLIGTGGTVSVNIPIQFGKHYHASASSLWPAYMTFFADSDNKVDEYKEDDNSRGVDVPVCQRPVLATPKLPIKSQ